MTRSLLIAVSICALAGCRQSITEGGNDGGNGGGDGGGHYQSVTVQPATATLSYVLGGPRATQVFHAIAVENGQSLDVSASCTWSVADQSYGSFASNTFTSGVRGGQTTVTAVCGNVQGTATVTIQVSGAILGTGVDAGVATLFQNAQLDGGAGVPSIEYPLDGAIAPVNIPPMDVQWTTGGNDLFHVRFAATNLTVDLYTTSADAQLDAASWNSVTESTQDGALGITVEGLLSTQPGTKYQSASQTLKMSHDPINSTAIYWWASSQGSILSQVFGEESPPTLVRANCTACHSLSRSGTRIGYSRCVANNCGPTYLGFMKYDVPTSSWLDTMNADNKAYAGSYTTFSPVGYPFPDDTKSVSLAALSTCALQLFDPDLGMPVASNVGTVSTEGPGAPRCPTMPDWSADGHSIAFASTPNAGDYIDIQNSGIAVMSYAYDAGTHVFGDPQMILTPPITVPSGQYTNLFFPSWSPDGQYIVFDAAQGNWRNFTVAASPGQRMMLTTPDGGWVTELANLNGPGNLDVTWPHWAPTPASDYYWIVFSSERDYGHLLTAANTNSTCVQNGVQQCKQIWLSAISKAALSGSGPPTADPSAPPVWLPGQLVSADNISPYWTQPLPFQ